MHRFLHIVNHHSICICMFKYKVNCSKLEIEHIASLVELNKASSFTSYNI